MATNPYFTQYHTQRFSFIGSPQQRDGTYVKDQRFLNMYPELIKSPISDGKKYYLKKRPGMGTFFSVPAGTANGLYYWANNNTYYTAVGGILYNGTSPLITLTSSTVNVGFAEYRTDSLDVLFVCDGTNAWLITLGNTVTHITDPNFPSSHIPTPIFLDGYIFLASAATQTIHNSALLDPTTWPSDGFIDAEMYPDNIVALAKQQNYICAIGGMSVEFFYDNANATGSPLQRNAPAVSQFGSPAPQTVSQTEKNVVLVGSTSNGGRTVWLIEGFQPTEIANEPVREALDLEAGSIVSAFASTIQCAGHKWYILNLVGAGRTFVYDFEEQMWHEWSSGTSQAVFAWKWSADAGNGSPAFLNYSTGQVGQLSPSNYTDLGTSIDCVVITSKLDFDAIKRKRIYRLSLITDSPAADNSGINMAISWSDDDYNTFTTPKNLDVSSTYPTITQLGYTRRRAFKFEYIQPYALRLEAFELDIIQEVRR